MNRPIVWIDWKLWCEGDERMLEHVNHMPDRSAVAVLNMVLFDKLASRLCTRYLVLISYTFSTNGGKFIEFYFHKLRKCSLG